MTDNKEDSDSFSPIPFAELTIPYLRQRKYESELTSLEEVSQDSSYITYITSYDSDQLRINALLTKPTGREPEEGWPAIVFIHGYIPPSQYQTGERYSDYVDYLARNNFVVFKIDLRGHGASEGEPSSAYYSSDYVIDTLNAYAALQNLDFVNPNQIGLWGHSMGGNIILRSLVVKPDIPVAVIWAGSVFTYQDFIDYGIDDDSYQPPSPTAPRRQYRQDLFDTYGSFSLDSNFWS
ncbi:MAG: alpha/beta fold hydrolase [Patescibacteria group bacterium]|nr:alpha/beta fold hydrolase [Patescibacteria group bacterium]